jgi:hypothetical protein
MKSSLLRVAVVVACGLLLTGVTSREAVGAAPPGGRSSRVSLDGGRVHYRSYGSGREAIVFIHGWTCNLTFWNGQIPELSKRTRVLAVDLPGHGESDKPQVSYTMVDSHCAGSTRNSLV